MKNKSTNIDKNIQREAGSNANRDQQRQQAQGQNHGQNQKSAPQRNNNDARIERKHGSDDSRSRSQR